MVEFEADDALAAVQRRRLATSVSNG